MVGITGLEEIAFMQDAQSCSPSSDTYCLVLVSAASEAEAQAIATTLVQEKLAACVSLMPITSIYTWDNQVQQSSEWQLLIKTAQRCFEALEQRVQTLHSYEVPEIIAIPIQSGALPYLNWIASSVSCQLGEN
ncbi:MAG TPA: divalent-cation tolerance protein CutA [Stenomitos sp.]